MMPSEMVSGGRLSSAAVRDASRNEAAQRDTKPRSKAEKQKGARDDLGREFRPFVI
ncbi:hypothetical protein [Rhodovulum sp. PH10]|uniref:hypothetical protein n=1 Tax=Rhodovulum sp. PH10 TaxID=1187851 RepID=UPI0012FB8429|nr:hypothetical protein [Rhodovulum sp. PH10]